MDDDYSPCDSCSTSVKSLLVNLKSTVEDILATGSNNVWDTYGALCCLCRAMKQILCHELKSAKNISGPMTNFWPFVQSLRWFQPAYIPFIEKIPRISQSDESECSQRWIEQSLQDHSLSNQLVILSSNPENMSRFYNDKAFLRQPSYFHAMCLCLKAVEQNNAVYLTDISLELLSSPTYIFNSLNNNTKTDVTSEDGGNEIDVNKGENIIVEHTEVGSLACDKEMISTNGQDDPLTNHLSSFSECDDIEEVQEGYESHRHTCDTDQLTNGSNVSEKQLTDSGVISEGNGQKRDLGLKSLSKDELSMNDFYKNQLKSNFIHRSSAVDRRLSESSNENGENRRLNKPLQGQSLRHYLSSQDFHTCVNLDKENAHFSISEAVIAAIERMKWNHKIPPSRGSLQSNVLSDSDETVHPLKQRIRIRKHNKLKECENGQLSDDAHDSSKTLSISPISSSHIASVYSSEDVSDSEEVDFEISNNEKRNLNMLKGSGLSLSMASLYSDADLQKSVQTDSVSSQPNFPCHSAETVAMALLKKYSDTQLPKASDLDWLVSEHDVPQTLLPLPNSLPVSPDDGENSDILPIKPRIRGNLEWAPPRNQIIFSIHPKTNRKVLLSKQNYRCAGCGMKIELDYIKRLKYCNYTGKYFCKCCHSNALAYIPANIIHNWDWSKYPVSNFSMDTLKKIFDEAYYNIIDISPSLVKKVKSFSVLANQRMQLRYLNKFVTTCKYADSLSSTLDKLPKHWISEQWLYSMADFHKVREGTLLITLRDVIDDCIRHIKQCEICSERGFVCEICNNDSDIIYPFELGKVYNCADCRACYHKLCFKATCPKCSRLSARKETVKSLEVKEATKIE